MNSLTCSYSKIFLAVADANGVFPILSTWLGRIFFLLAIIAFGSGIQKWIHHDVSEAKKAFIVAALLAFGWAIVTALFRSAGMPVIDISP